MTVECVAILVLLACIALVIRQKGNQSAFFAVIPLYWMPVAYLFTAAVLPCLPVESEIILLVFQAGSYLLALVGGIIADRTQNYKGTIKTGLVIYKQGLPV